MARKIVITIGDRGELDVWEGESHTDTLCFGEMLETITDLCHPKLSGVARYAMLTADEWHARHPTLTDRELAEVQPMSEWPKRITAHVYGSKETMWQLGEDIGLRGDALDLFRHALCEVQCTISVNADGTYQILEVKG